MGAFCSDVIDGPCHINLNTIVTLQVVNDVVEAVSKKRLIVLVGASGSGKRSAIVQACKDADLVYRQKLVDPSHFKADDLPTDQMHACIVNNLLFNTIEDVDKYLHQIKSLNISIYWVV